MLAISEGHMFFGVGSRQIDAVGFGELASITIRRREQQPEMITSCDSRSTDLDIDFGLPKESPHRSFESEHFFDEGVDESTVRSHLTLQLLILGQMSHDVGDQGGGRFVSRNEKLLKHAQLLVIGEFLPIDACGRNIREKIRSRRATPIFDLSQEIVGELACRHDECSHLVQRRGMITHGHDDVIGPPFESSQVLVGDPESQCNDRHRESHGITGHDVHPPSCFDIGDDVAQEVCSDALHLRFEGADSIGPKSRIDQLALASMFRRVRVEQDCDSAPAESGQRLAHGGIAHDLFDPLYESLAAGPRTCRVGTRELGRVTQDGTDLVVSGHQPRPQLGIEIQAASVPQTAEDRIRARDRRRLTVDQVSHTRFDVVAVLVHNLGHHGSFRGCPDEGHRRRPSTLTPTDGLISYCGRRGERWGAMNRSDDVTITHDTFCRVCHASCPLEVDVRNGRPIAVRGIASDPLFQGYTCIKGRQLPEQMTHPARLRQPLMRSDDGRLVETTSSKALDAVAAQLRRIIDEDGPRSVATYTGTGGYQNSLALPSARAFHHGIGSSSMYTSVTIDQPAKATAPFRAGIWEAGYHNFSGADVLMAIGYNPMVSSFGPVGGLQGTNPFVVLRDAQRDGLKLIVIDPRRSELASQADLHLAIRPGEDPTLLAGITKIILDEDLFDQEFCSAWVGDLEQLARAVAPFDIDLVARRCGVESADVEAAARMFAAGRRGTAGAGTGPNMAPHSGLVEHFVIVLNTLCGRVNRPGDRIESGHFLVADTPRRAHVVAPRNPTPGPHARVRDLRGIRGEMPTSTLAEEILTPGSGRIRALIVNGGNPVVAWPDQELTIRAMQELDLLVVIDHRLSATAEFADVVFAPTLSLERADVPHLMDRWFRAPYTNYTAAVTPRTGDVLNEWEIFWELSRRLGTELTFAGGVAPMDHRPTDDDILDLAYHGSRMPMNEVRANKRTIHSDRAIVVQPADPSCTARFTLAPDDIESELRAVLLEGSATRALGVTDGDYPFRLVSRRLRHVLNSLGTELSALAAKGTTNPAYMHPADMTDLDLQNGDIIEITSPRAAIRAVASSAPDVRPGVISMAHAWGGSSLDDDKVRDIGSPTNRLVSVDIAHDAVTGMAVQSAIPVQVRLVERANDLV